MKKYLVTGGAGFIGSYLVRELISNGEEVIVFDNFERGSISRLRDFKDKIELINGDIRDYESIEKIVKKVDVIYHLAAVNGTENFYKYPKLVLDVGIKGILNVMDAGRKFDIEHIIVASSAEVYQSPNSIPTSEEEMLKIPNVFEPRYSYGCSKIATEMVALNWGKDMNCVQIFRPHNIYGPDMGWKHVIPNLINKINNIKNSGNTNLEIFGNGSQTRAFCYVSDLIDGLRIMEKTGAKHDLYHIGTEEELSIRELVKLIADVIGIEVNIVTSNSPEGETKRRCPNIHKIRDLGYTPSISIEQGIKRTVEWYKRNPEALDGNNLL
tara:strand:- start:912 stop:1886 length:975 start_codon:yes stop_codon:yes gene_type:complete